MAEEPRLSEVDKLLKKINLIYTGIKGADPNAIDLSKVTDEFEKYRYTFNQKLSEAETLLIEKDNYKGMEPEIIHKRTKVTQKIEDLLKELEPMLEQLSRSLRSQKKKNKGDYENRERLKNLLEERFKLLKDKNEGVMISDNVIQNNKSSLQQIDDILTKNAQNQAQSRELFEEEKQAIEKAKQKVKDQDVLLDQLAGKVKQLGAETKDIRTKIDETGKQIKKTTDTAKKTEKKLQTTNAKLKELLDKVRSGDKICIDIILIMICLGLIAVLYNIIKTKLVDAPSSSTTPTPTKTFLYI